MIRLVEYEESLADAVTRMWHESADGWPPGFNCASKTAEYVADKHRDGAYIHTTLAMEDERVLGYIRTRQYGGEPDAAYVAFINVVTEMHGHGIGKRLLLDSIDRVSAAGYSRIDLDTWPGNLKAVPLYKKTGFLWVPDRDVHMENYMPLLLRRPEVEGLLEGEYWYDHLTHGSLEASPDLHETDSKRRIYTYRLERDGRRIEAEIDLAGRCLSGWSDGERELRLRRSERKLVFSRPARIALEGSGLPGSIDVSCHEDLEGPDRMETDGASGSIEVVPRPLAIPYSRRERAPRVTLRLPLETPLELGMGIDAGDAVEVKDLAVRLLAGEKQARIHLKRRVPDGKCVLHWRVDKADWSARELDLSKAVFSAVDLPVGDLAPGLHTMEIRLDAGQAQGPVRKVLVSRGPLKGAETWSCPRGAVMETSTLRLRIRPTGGLASISFLGHHGGGGSGNLRLQAGPPMFAGDLWAQRYSVEAAESGLRASCKWLSRPGLEFRVFYSLDPCGVVRAQAEVSNSSEAPAEVFFAAINWEHLSWPGDVLMPLEGGMLMSEQIFQRFPDYSSDYPREISEMASPVMGGFAAAICSGTLANFRGWDRIESGCPRTEKEVVQPGETLRSPSMEKLISAGGPWGMSAAAAAAGWDLKPPRDYIGFPGISCYPLMPERSSVSMTNPLKAKRSACIDLDGEQTASGELGAEDRLEADVGPPGLHSVCFVMSGVERERKVLVTEKAEVTRERDGDNLLLRGEDLRIAINPSARGHVSSIRLAGREWAFASDPKPRAFAWFNPWYGGIVPWISPGDGLMGRIVRLEEMEPSVEECEQRLWDYGVPSWRMTWKLDHEDWMSAEIAWSVGILPGFPAVVAELVLRPLEGSLRNCNGMIAGFVAPGGDRKGCRLTPRSGRNISMRRTDSGAFLLGSRLATVTGDKGHMLSVLAGDSSVLFAEDYASEGAFVAAMGLQQRMDGALRSSALWLLDESVEDSAALEALVSYDRERSPIVLP